MNCIEVVKNIIIPLVAAVVGGGMTLLGVLLTIRHQRKTIKNEEVAKCKPTFIITQEYFDKNEKVKCISINNTNACPQEIIDNNLSDINAMEKYDKYNFIDVRLINYDISYFKIEGIYFNNIFFPKWFDDIIDKNSKTLIEIKTPIYLPKGTKIIGIKLVVCDIFGNKYEAILTHQLNKIGEKNEFNIVIANESTYIHSVRK